MVKLIKNKKEENRPDGKFSRREFFGQAVGAAAIAGTAGAFAVPLAGTAQEAATPMAGTSPSPDAIEWDYEADVVVIGGGCTGLPAAIRARDLGATVIVVEQNFEPGGKMLHSGAQVSLGGGDPLQLRDIAGEADPEGFITVPPQEGPEEMTEDVDFLFRDMTDWSVMDATGQAPYRYNEADLLRAWADNCSATRTFLMDNYVRMGRISGTHGTGGMSRARRAVCFLMEGETTDIKAGTVSSADAGTEGESSSHFAPRIMGDGSGTIGPGARTNGAALARPLEFAAREKGVEFILNMHMDEIIREQPFSGRVIGIKASYSPRMDPDTGARLEPLMTNGNIDEQGTEVFIKANKGIVIGAGGH